MLVTVSSLSKLTETSCPSGFVAVKESSEMFGAVVSTVKLALAVPTPLLFSA